MLTVSVLFLFSVGKLVCQLVVRMVLQSLVRNMQEAHLPTAQIPPHPHHQVFKIRRGNHVYIRSKIVSLALQDSIEENYKVYHTHTKGQMAFVPLGSPFYFQVNLKFKIWSCDAACDPIMNADWLICGE